MLLLFFHFILASLATFILASLAHSQFVLHELSVLGIKIDFATRLSTSLDDLIGLLPGYGGIIALGLLIGFSLMGLLRKLRPTTGYWVYPLAGFIAMLTMLLAMHPLLDVTLIAGARSLAGLVAQCLAGAFGGWAFWDLRARTNQAKA